MLQILPNDFDLDDIYRKYKGESSKEGIVVGRDKIKATEVFSDGMILDANILGYTYLGDSLAVGFGNWTQLDTTSNTMVRGQWGNVFKVDGDTAYLVMESAGLSK